MTAVLILNILFATLVVAGIVGHLALAIHHDGVWIRRAASRRRVARARSLVPA